MKEAIHIIEKEWFRLPDTASSEDIRNYKTLAKKGIYRCPYCEAELIVRSGDERGLHFSHRHSESCEQSKKVEAAEKKYEKQTKRETTTHRVMVNIVFDELSVQAKTRPRMIVEYGYKAKQGLKEFPDIWVKVGNNELAISIVTNVNPNEDMNLAKSITKRHHYFTENGMKPIWFIERRHLSVEKEKHAIVLWDAEAAISLKTQEDEKWDALLVEMIKDRSFFEPFNYPLWMEKVMIDVRSMYYIYSKEDRIVVKVQRFMNAA